MTLPLNFGVIGKLVPAGACGPIKFGLERRRGDLESGSLVTPCCAAIVLRQRGSRNVKIGRSG